MFGLFKKKPSLEEAVSTCVELAAQSQIQVVLDKGLYSGFIVTLDTKNLANHLIYQEAISAFVTEIDRHITNGRFDDPSKNLWGDPLLDVLTNRSNRGDTKGLPRIVLSTKGEPVFKWQ